MESERMQAPASDSIDCRNIMKNMEERKNMKAKQIIVIGVLVVCVIVLAVVFTSSGSLTGQWNIQGERNSAFPSILILQSGGAGNYDGFPVSWAQKENVLQIGVLGSVQEYRYTLSGNTLNLLDSCGEKVAYSRGN